jgi:hypothetical protein
MSATRTEQARTAPDHPARPVFIVITQCLQNGFFLADENRLCLSRDIVNRMLVGDQYENGRRVDWTKLGEVDEQNRRKIADRYLQKGPLYQFFEGITSPSARHEPLHIIHIRDWHAPSKQYDEERRLYGVHCEANTWDAKPIQGFERYLCPWELDGPNSRADGKAQARSAKGYSGNNNVCYYDVRSDSVFDFRTPASNELRKHLDDVKAALPPESRYQIAGSFLQILLDQIIGFDEQQRQAYVLVIGVYTDIKIKILLTGLRARYDIQGLFVSDVLTDAPTLERHIDGLDFTDKVLNVQVLHNLNDAVSVVNSGATHIVSNKLTETTLSFREYANYFLDREKLLAFQDQRLLKYLELTSGRSLEVYQQIYNASRWLNYFGIAFLALTILAIILRVLGVPNITPDVILSMTGLTAVQFFTSFFLIPFVRMRNNLNSLVRLRNYLETYSNITGLLRYHLTKVERLQPNLKDPDFAARAEQELNLLERQIRIIQDAAEKMSQTFHDLVPQEPEPPLSGEERQAGTDTT